MNIRHYPLCITIIIIIIITVILVIYKFREYVENTKYELYNTNKNRCNIDKSGFIKEVKKSIPYYANLKGDKLPIVSKSKISSQSNMFMNKYVGKIENSVNTSNNNWATKKITQEDASVYECITYIYNLYNGKAIANITGGSSGNYFYQWYTLDEYKRGLYGFFKCWINMGWTPKERVMLYYFHGSNAVKLLNVIPLPNITSIVPKLTKDGDISLQSAKEFINHMNTQKPELIVSYPSLIFRISQLVYQHDLIILHCPKYMDLSADFLFSCQYNFIKSVFKDTDIRLSYGTIEFGQIAQQIPGKMYDYEVFDDIVDVENDTDNNLIITNYLFTTQPMIRYLTDDKGSVSVSSNGTIISNLVGKTHEKYDYILIDNMIESNHNDIINIRIDKDSKIIYITTLSKKYELQYINNYFKDHTIMYKVCGKRSCKTIDTYNRKNTPILKEYKL